MPAKTSKEVTDRQRACRFLLTAFERQGDHVFGQLAETIRPLLDEGQTEPDFHAAFDGLRRWLDVSIGEMVTLDEGIFDKNARLDRARKDRDAAIQDLAQELSRLRLSIENQYQAPQLERLGFETPIVRVAVPLLRQAERLVETLGSAELVDLLGEPSYSQPFDPGTHQAELAARAEKLSGLLLLIDQLKRDFDRSLVGKGRAMTEHDGLFLQSARIFEALCRLAKETQLAERVRRSLRRPVGGEEAAMDEEPGITGADDGPVDGGNGDTSDGVPAVATPAARGPAAPANEDAPSPHGLPADRLVS